MSTEAEKVKKWWDIIKSSGLAGALDRAGEWDHMHESDQSAVTKAYRAASKLDNLSVDRSGITFIGKIPEDHKVEFIVNSDRTAILKATPPDGGEPLIYELGRGFDWQDLKRVASIPAPVIVKRKYNNQTRKRAYNGRPV